MLFAISGWLMSRRCERMAGAKRNGRIDRGRIKRAGRGEQGSLETAAWIELLLLDRGHTNYRATFRWPRAQTPLSAR